MQVLAAADMLGLAGQGTMALEDLNMQAPVVVLMRDRAVQGMTAQAVQHILDQVALAMQALVAVPTLVRVVRDIQDQVVQAEYLIIADKSIKI